MWGLGWSVKSRQESSIQEKGIWASKVDTLAVLAKG